MTQILKFCLDNADKYGILMMLWRLATRVSQLRSYITMKDRFDLEQEINVIYGIAEQLATVSEAIIEERLSVDDTANVLEGIRIMLNLHTEKLHDTMCQVCKLDNYKEFV